jgi:hypothetical protein
VLDTNEQLQLLRDWFLRLHVCELCPGNLCEITLKLVLQRYLIIIQRLVMVFSARCSRMLFNANDNFCIV